MFKPGLVSISFRSHSPKEIMEAARDAGLYAIEWGSDVHAPCGDIEKLNSIAALQKEYGIRCCSYGTYFRMGSNSPEEIIPYIKAAKILGTDILRIWCGNKGSDQYTDDEKKALFNEAKKLSEIAKNENATLCLEFHPNTFSDTLESSLEIIKAADSSNFRMYWQPNQFRSIVSNLYEAEMIAEYVVNIHVFNWIADKKYPLIEAIDIWKQYASFFKGDHFMLLEFMPDNDINSLKREAAALAQIIEEK
jgi:3-dehydroshikimate dehydratase